MFLVPYSGGAGIVCTEVHVANTSYDKASVEYGLHEAATAFMGHHYSSLLANILHKGTCFFPKQTCYKNEPVRNFCVL